MQHLPDDRYLAALERQRQRITDGRERLLHALLIGITANIPPSPDAPHVAMHKAIARPLTVSFEDWIARVSFRLKFGEDECATILIPWRGYEIDKLRETCTTLLRGAQFTC